MVHSMNYKHSSSAMSLDPSTNPSDPTQIQLPPSSHDEPGPTDPVSIETIDTNPSPNSLKHKMPSSSPELFYDKHSKNKHLSMTIHKQRKLKHKRKKRKLRPDDAHHRAHKVARKGSKSGKSQQKTSKKGSKHNRPRLRKTSSYGHDHPELQVLDEIGDFTPRPPTGSSKKIQVVRPTKRSPHYYQPYTVTAPSNNPLHQYNYNKKKVNKSNANSNGNSPNSPEKLRNRSTSTRSLRALMREEYDEQQNEQKLSDLQYQLYNQSPVTITPSDSTKLTNGSMNGNGINGMNGNGMNGFNLSQSVHSKSPLFPSFPAPRSLVHGPRPSRSPGRSPFYGSNASIHSVGSPQQTLNDGGEVILGMELGSANVKFRSLDLDRHSSTGSRSISTDYRFEGRVDYQNPDQVEHDLSHCLGILRAMNKPHDNSPGFVGGQLSMERLIEMEQIIEDLKAKIIANNNDHGDDGGDGQSVQETDSTHSSMNRLESQSRATSCHTHTTEEHEDEDVMSEDEEDEEEDGNGRLIGGVQFFEGPPLSTKGSGEFG